MNNLVKIFLLVLIFSLAACANQKETLDAIKPEYAQVVKKRAAFDFNCPIENIQLEETGFGVPTNTYTVVGEYQVKGCEKRQAYNARSIEQGQISVIAVGSPGDTTTEPSKNQ